MNAPSVLDPCCGPRMMWFDRQDPRALFGDCRAEIVTVPDRSHGRPDGQRVITIEPDTLLDFRALPFPDGAFRMDVGRVEIMGEGIAASSVQSDEPGGVARDAPSK